MANSTSTAQDRASSTAIIDAIEGGQSFTTAIQFLHLTPAQAKLTLRGGGYNSSQIAAIANNKGSGLKRLLSQLGSSVVPLPGASLGAGELAAAEGGTEAAGATVAGETAAGAGAGSAASSALAKAAEIAAGGTGIFALVSGWTLTRILKLFAGTVLAIVALLQLSRMAGHSVDPAALVAAA